MAKPRRVLVTLESRATFGYSVNVIKRAMADPALEVQTLLTGMHLMPELGNSQSMLHRAQIPISATVPLTPGTGRAGWPQAMGHAISGFAEAYDRLDPEIVLFDEPTAGLDPITADEIDSLIASLKEERKMTSIVVTHDIHAVRFYSDRVVMLREGNIAMDGTFEEFEKSKDKFIVQFLKTAA